MWNCAILHSVGKQTCFLQLAVPVLLVKGWYQTPTLLSVVKCPLL